VISRDGGVSWAPVRTTPAAQPAPPGAAVLCRPVADAAACTLQVVEPSGRSAPLSGRPALAPAEGPVSGDGDNLWVAGTDPGSGRPAVAVSADRGRTWSTHVFADVTGCAERGCDPPELAVGGGQAAYAVVADPASGRYVVYRGTAAGGWERLADVVGDPPRYPGAVWSFVASDGAHVLAQPVSGAGRDGDLDRVRFWSAAGGSGYRPVALDGLPDTVYPVRRTPDGWFYTTSYGDHSVLYGSADGWRWAPVTS
jgi:hypothetical protein